MRTERTRLRKTEAELRRLERVWKDRVSARAAKTPVRYGFSFLALLCGLWFLIGAAAAYAIPF